MVRYEVRGDPVEATGTMRLTTTTFTRELRFLGENETSEFTSGAFEFIAPFDEKKGTISWNADTEPRIHRFVVISARITREPNNLGTFAF